jgi:ribosomal protein S18 acetylase RimI-like enzyme
VLALEAFDPGQAREVASWARTAEEVGAWCARTEAPVPAAVVVGWAGRPDVRAFIARANGRIVAYGELWLDPDEGEVELAHLIVDPAVRGRGMGVALARALVARARSVHPELDRVILRVRPSNAAALRTYARAGFERVPSDEATAWNVGQPEAFAWMRIP